MVPQMQVVGHMPKEYLPINSFDIHYSHETLPLMRKYFNGENLANFMTVIIILPNFSSVKVFLHMVF